MKIIPDSEFFSSVVSNRITKIILYSCYFIIAFALFLLLQFPFNIVFEEYWQKNMSSVPLDVYVSKISPAFPPGIKMKSVEITGKDDLAPFFPLNIPSLSIRFSPIALARKKKDFKINAELLDGELWLKYWENKEGLKIKGEFEDLKLQAYKPIQHMNILVAGNMKAVYGLQMEEKNIKKMNGEILFSIKDGIVDQLSFFGISVPRITFSSVEIEFDIENGTANIVKAAIKGNDINGEISGDIILHEKPLLSLLDCEIDLTLAESLMKDETISGLLPLIGATNDGKVFLKLKGTFKKPRATPVMPGGGRKVRERGKR